MPPKDILALLLAAVAMFLVFRGAILRQKMTASLNAVLPEQSQFSTWWQWNPKRHADFKREYQRVFPEEKSGSRYRLLVAAGTGLMIAAYWLLFQ